MFSLAELSTFAVFTEIMEIKMFDMYGPQEHLESINSEHWLHTAIQM